MFDFFLSKEFFVSPLPGLLPVSSEPELLPHHTRDTYVPQLANNGAPADGIPEDLTNFSTQLQYT